MSPPRRPWVWQKNRLVPAKLLQLDRSAKGFFFGGTVGTRQGCTHFTHSHFGKSTTAPPDATMRCKKHGVHGRFSKADACDVSPKKSSTNFSVPAGKSLDLPMEDRPVAESSRGGFRRTRSAIHMLPRPCEHARETGGIAARATAHSKIGPLYDFAAASAHGNGSEQAGGVASEHVLQPLRSPRRSSDQAFRISFASQKEFCLEPGHGCQRAERALAPRSSNILAARSDRSNEASEMRPRGKGGPARKRTSGEAPFKLKLDVYPSPLSPLIWRGKVASGG